MKPLQSVQSLALFATVLCGAGNAQLAAFGGGEPQPRSMVRVFYWDEGKNLSPGQVMVHYGRPEWQPDYDDAAKFDTLTKGKVVRLGKDYWTTLDTTLPLQIGERKVEAGEYFLATSRSADGKSWELAFIDPAACRKAKMDAFQSESAPVLFKVPLQTSAEPQSEKLLSILLAKDDQHPELLTFTIRWGKLRLTAPVKVILD